jgi:hypothetical protein
MIFYSLSNYDITCYELPLTSHPEGNAQIDNIWEKDTAMCFNINGVELPRFNITVLFSQ